MRQRRPQKVDDRQTARALADAYDYINEVALNVNNGNPTGISTRFTMNPSSQSVPSAKLVYDELALKLNLSGGTLTGHLLFTDNTYDIGASGATRPRTGYFGTSVVAPTLNGTSGIQLNGTSINTTGTLSNVAYLGSASHTFTGTGTHTFAGNTSVSQLFVDNAIGTASDVRFMTSGSYRWMVRRNNTAETGSNAGADFVIERRADDGSTLGSGLFIKRSTGYVGLGGNTNPAEALDVTGNIKASGTVTGAASISSVGAASSVNLTNSATNPQISIHDINTGYNWYLQHRMDLRNHFRIQYYNGTSYYAPFSIELDAPNNSITANSTGVGIRTAYSSITDALTVTGNIKASGQLQTNSSVNLFVAPNFTIRNSSNLTVIENTYTGAGGIYLRSYKSSTQTGDIILNDLGGNVKIGTGTPSEALDVTGNIKASADIYSSGDTYWTGDGSGIPYGSCYGNEIAWAQAGAVQNTWYKISDADMSDGQLNLVIHDGSGKLTVTKAGRYKVDYSASAEVSSVNKHIQVGISVSGTEVSDGISHYEASVPNAQFHVASSVILDLAANAYIEISMRTTDTGTPDLAVDHLNIVITMVGGT